ncbi:MAG: hypothetical protein NT027_01525 [Proteobacteria bacterium]|nr:hypothetical protein [Pseudomonadota bacterium]
MRLFFPILAVKFSILFFIFGNGCKATNGVKNDNAELDNINGSFPPPHPVLSYTGWSHSPDRCYCEYSNGLKERFDCSDWQDKFSRTRKVSTLCGNLAGVKKLLAPLSGPGTEASIEWHPKFKSNAIAFGNFENLTEIMTSFMKKYSGKFECEDFLRFADYRNDESFSLFRIFREDSPNELYVYEGENLNKLSKELISLRGEEISPTTEQRDQFYISQGYRFPGTSRSSNIFISARSFPDRLAKLNNLLVIYDNEAKSYFVIGRVAARRTLPISQYGGAYIETYRQMKIGNSLIVKNAPISCIQ